uniref:Dickkopf N-terminal cysteine-rich domain-containing protein n=1 Tax=Haptolina brevifila TaxID=156173 RepID=A0A7S2C239_9EUKA|mmetsp:Transcript_19432/g.39715  ORF Transcript_19432/g.39715 Transcript_19432/m.39715 type:complete len:381 (+) Transcript_19432:95-1237(+)|eukprot:CAMPEP_0174725392 /NCGR_PEP_ID=MMETSP1094-20130205/45446_1 /TAXON_ID=156173 /ORGANISM="Chrysochromulina brevifilum, Strain UTEX LB 985" /LENGTH=380 /DNA_ID=CAMNT_0015926781 /DNA_START=94 /DNA_END=1236 /DNA_ORIENTATION=-
MSHLATILPMQYALLLCLVLKVGAGEDAPAASPGPENNDPDLTEIILADSAPPSSPSTCSKEFEVCTQTGCCSNPGFDCYKRVGKEYAQCFRKQLPGPCKDSETWLCPGWEKCAPAFSDCRSSKCCRNPKHFCLRRPHLFYAQCRPLPGDASDPSMCSDTKDWLCPGWERCAGQHEECTKSRCCTDAGFSCTLNETMLHLGQGWHAFCQPPLNRTAVSSASIQAAHSNTSEHALVSFLTATSASLATFRTKLEKLTSKQAVHQFDVASKRGADQTNGSTPWLCEAASEWMCRSRWEASYKDHLSYLDEIARNAEDTLTPLGLATVFLAVLLVTLSAVGCIIGLVIRQRRVHAHLIQVELELAALRAFAPTSDGSAGPHTK